MIYSSSSSYSSSMVMEVSMGDAVPPRASAIESLVSLLTQSTRSEVNSMTPSICFLQLSTISSFRSSSASACLSASRAQAVSSRARATSWPTTPSILPVQALRVSSSKSCGDSLPTSTPESEEQVRVRCLSFSLGKCCCLPMLPPRPVVPFILAHYCCLHLCQVPGSLPLVPTSVLGSV